MKSQEQIEILTKVFSQMANKFTSNYFNKKAREYGCPLSADMIKLFLNKHASNLSRKVWIKNNIQKDFISDIQMKIQLSDESKNIDLKISDAISLLKSNGYKILKEKIEYEEI
jgi:hypothetical protein